MSANITSNTPNVQESNQASLPAIREKAHLKGTDQSPTANAVTSAANYEIMIANQMQEAMELMQALQGNLGLGPDSNTTAQGTIQKNQERGLTEVQQVALQLQEVISKAQLEYANSQLNGTQKQIKEDQNMIKQLQEQIVQLQANEQNTCSIVTMIQDHNQINSDENEISQISEQIKALSSNLPAERREVMMQCIDVEALRELVQALTDQNAGLSNAFSTMGQASSQAAQTLTAASNQSSNSSEMQQTAQLSASFTEFGQNMGLQGQALLNTIVKFSVGEWSPERASARIGSIQQRMQQSLDNLSASVGSGSSMTSSLDAEV